MIEQSTIVGNRIISGDPSTMAAAGMMLYCQIASSVIGSYATCNLTITHVIFERNMILSCSKTRREDALDTATGMVLGAALALRARQRWQHVDISNSIWYANEIRNGIDDIVIKMCLSDPEEMRDDWWVASAFGTAIASYRDDELYGFLVSCDNNWCVPFIITNCTFTFNEMRIKGIDAAQSAIHARGTVAIIGMHVYIVHCAFESNKIVISDIAATVFGEGDSHCLLSYRAMHHILP